MSEKNDCDRRERERECVHVNDTKERKGKRKKTTKLNKREMKIKKS